MSDFILFWIAKAIAEIAVGLSVVVFFVGVLLVIEHRSKQRTKKRKGASHE